ncbi:MAG: hypothetical protein AB7S49_06105 [Arcobacter sp.]|uniref:hypothetical protein n=1 Tax=Arcobacter sp. TaxID=1872629 RepID=UPI003CFCF783
MRKIIFLLLIIVSNAISYDGVITKEDMEWRKVIVFETHGSHRAEWTKLVTMPNYCKFTVEKKLNDIVMVSLNILNKKSIDWLKGDYLKYVNAQCDLKFGLYDTKRMFDYEVNSFLYPKAKPTFKEKFMDFAVLVFYVILVFSILSYVFVGIQRKTKN